MAFGIAGSESAGSGQFLSRIQYDSRVGFWTIVKRVQQPDGSWADDKSEPFKNPTFLIDWATLEVGYIKFASPPDFRLTPFGSTIPPCPDEMVQGDNGKPRKAFLPGFRVKVYGPKLFGDTEAYTFSNTAKTVLDPMDELHMDYLQAPEAKQGMVPLVQVTGTKAIKIDGPRGSNTYYAPVFKIAGWHPRPEAFGAATAVPVVNLANQAAPQPTLNRQAPVATRAPEPPGGHPAFDAPPAEDQYGDRGPPSGMPQRSRGPAPAMSDLEDTIPF